MERFGITGSQKTAVRKRNVLELLDQGGNIDCLAKLTGMLGMGMQDFGAQQSGMTKEEFKAMLLRQGA